MEKCEIAVVTPQFIKKIVEKHANVDDIGVKSRTRPLPYYRFIAFALCKKFCYKKVSLAEIGKHFGGRDHATVLHGVNQFYLFEFEKWFKPFYEIYIDCFKEIKHYLKEAPKYEVLMSIDEVKHSYLIKHIELMEKSHSVIGSLTTKLNNLRHRPIFKEIAGLDVETLMLFEKRAEAFLKMNKNN